MMMPSFPYLESFFCFLTGCRFTDPTQMASLLKEFVKASSSFVTNSILHSRSRVLLQKPLSLIQSIYLFFFNQRGFDSLF
ncbi:hypothetical protein HanPSC8_Chr17g0771001 [Helianthus annuus]|nr:hypothetical protein HanPSC8_Chr17g0771001 [Helianthus annuus]